MTNMRSASEPGAAEAGVFLGSTFFLGFFLDDHSVDLDFVVHRGEGGKVSPGADGKV